MCGIFGFLTYCTPLEREVILRRLVEGLQRLEYRGYDSAGLSFDSNGKPTVVKSRGNIAKLIAELDAVVAEKGIDLKQVVDTHVGIAHTRWATHGVPSPTNSHPHVSDPDNAFVVVHNGIITNFEALKNFLTKEGYAFYSDTDTEVIPKLAKYIYDKTSEPLTFPELVQQVMKQLNGAYALLFKSTKYPNELVACKLGSPLILGIKESPMMQKDPTDVTIKDAECLASKHHASVHGVEYFLASDAAAVVEHTKQVMVLEDRDVLHIKSTGDFEVWHPSATLVDGALLQEDMQHVTRAIDTLQLEVTQIMKGNYPHYMLKEIHEQPDSITMTLRGRVMLQREHDSVRKDSREVSSGLHTTHSFIHAVAEHPPQAVASFDKPVFGTKRIVLGGLVDYLKSVRQCRRFLFVGCGTSFHAALAARSLMEQLADIPVQMELASDMVDRRAPIYRDDTAIFVSQSGETADTLRALEYAKACGALCVGVTNTVGSAIARMTHCGVHINAGAEIGVASTKAYTSQIVVMVMMALALSEDSMSKHHCRNRIMDDLVALPDAVRDVLKLDKEVQELAQDLKNENSLLVFGRGAGYATALEAALKVKEVALLHSEGILSGEMKHGPLALVDESLPIIVIATQDSMYEKNRNVIQQLRARQGRLIILCNNDDESMEREHGKGVKLLRVPSLPHQTEALQGILNIVPMQLLSYHLAVIRGLNVDQPRNLAKSVTTE